MRRGKSPKDAGMEALRRIKANTIEKRLQNARGEPNFNINFYILNAKGEYAGVTMYGPGPRGQRFAVCDEKGAAARDLRAAAAGRSRVGSTDQGSTGSRLRAADYADLQDRHGSSGRAGSSKALEIRESGSSVSRARAEIRSRDPRDPRPVEIRVIRIPLKIPVYNRGTQPVLWRPRIMRFYRLIGVALAAAIMFTGRPLAGRSEQTTATPSGASAFDALHFRQIGPASMSGRIADLAVYEANPSLYYVGTAHGGVWKTTNNGTTFEAQFQDQGLMSIGDVTISQSNPDLVWVGTGESNNRQSTSWGDGVYKSIDGGKTYTNMGLRTSRHINRIVIDPRDNDVVLVAATGSLWGPGGDRGVYKTNDAGRTWKQVLKVDDDTGANDLVMDPSNNQVLWASMYQRRRSACCMNGGGPGSGIWKSTDGGETWTRLKGGVLDGPLGRIAIDVYRKRPNILYALIEGPAAGGRGGRGAGGGPGGEAGPGAPIPRQRRRLRAAVGEAVAH